MRPEITVHLQRSVSVRDPLIVLGAPTAGLVGSIVARYLVETLDMPRVGSVHSAAFPAHASVHDGVAWPPMRVYALDTRCGPADGCRSLVVVESEFVPGRASAAEAADAVAALHGRTVLHAFAETLTQWAADRNAGLLAVPDAIPQPDGDAAGESPQAVAVASSPTVRDALAKSGVGFANHGALVGLPAALLSEADRRDVPAVGLLSPSRADVPDARAAARIVEVLDALVPRIDIETHPLIEQAERIENALKRQAEEQEAQAELHVHDRMFM